MKIEPQAEIDRLMDANPEYHYGAMVLHESQQLLARLPAPERQRVLGFLSVTIAPDLRLHPQHHAEVLEALREEGRSFGRKVAEQAARYVDQERMAKYAAMAAAEAKRERKAGNDHS